MKIAIITLNNPFEKGGGIESVVYNLSREMARLGHEIWIICLGNDEEETKTVNGVRLWILPGKRKKSLFWKSALFAIKGMKILKELEKRGIEVFIGQGGLSSPLVFYKPRYAKLFLVVHTLDEENLSNIRDCFRTRHFRELIIELIKYPMLKIWRIFYLYKFKRLIFVSKSVLEEFKKFYRFSNKECYIIPNGYPEEIIHHRSLDKKYDFIYAGRLDKRKCVDLIVKASRILKDKGYKFSVIIVGDGPWREDIKRHIRYNNLVNYIRLLGFLPYEDVLEIISRSKFLIVPSLYESDPLVIREALSLGVPCIVSDIPALYDKIENGKNGFIFKRCDHFDLAKKMEVALKVDDYEILSENARNSSGNFGWKKIAENYIRIMME